MSVPIPQIWKMFRTKSVRDVAMGTYILLILAMICYLIHAIYIHDAVFITAQSINIVLNSIVLTYMLKKRKIFKPCDVIQNTITGKKYIFTREFKGYELWDYEEWYKGYYDAYSSLADFDLSKLIILGNFKNNPELLPEYILDEIGNLNN